MTKLLSSILYGLLLHSLLRIVKLTSPNLNYVIILGSMMNMIIITMYPLPTTNRNLVAVFWTVGCCNFTIEESTAKVTVIIRIFSVEKLFSCTESMQKYFTPIQKIYKWKSKLKNVIEFIRMILCDQQLLNFRLPMCFPILDIISASPLCWLRHSGWPTSFASLPQQKRYVLHKLIWNRDHID